MSSNKAAPEWLILLAVFTASIAAVALPTAWSLMGNATNAMWYLGPLACMVVLASPPAGTGWRVFDLGAVIVSGLSGPFSILLTPVAALKLWVRRERWTLVLLAATAVTCMVQVTSRLLTPKPIEGRMPLGADALKLARLLVRRIVYNEWGVMWTRRPGYSLAAAVGAAVLVYAVLRAPLAMTSAASASSSS